VAAAFETPAVNVNKIVVHLFEELGEGSMQGRKLRFKFVHVVNKIT